MVLEDAPNSSKNVAFNKYDEKSDDGDSFETVNLDEEYEAVATPPKKVTMDHCLKTMKIDYASSSTRNRLKEELEIVRAELKEREQELDLAAEIGQMLLEK